MNAQVKTNASIEIILNDNDIDLIADHAIKKILAKAVAQVAPAKSFPKIGEFWPEQGGYLGAIMRGKDTPDYCLIVSEKEHEFTEEWGQQGNTINTNEWDGFANTKLMMISLGNYPAAKKCLEISAHGFNDWYLGSRREMRALYANASELFDQQPWYWTSTQYSAYYAYSQDFELGYQFSSDGKGDELRVRPVRRLFI